MGPLKNVSWLVSLCTQIKGWHRAACKPPDQVPHASRLPNPGFLLPAFMGYGKGTFTIFLPKVDRLWVGCSKPSCQMLGGDWLPLRAPTGDISSKTPRGVARLGRPTAQRVFIAVEKPMWVGFSCSGSGWSTLWNTKLLESPYFPKSVAYQKGVRSPYASARVHHRHPVLSE